MSRPKRRSFGLMPIVTALLVGALAYWAFNQYVGFADAPLAGLQSGQTLMVERGDSLATVLRKLRSAGVGDVEKLQWQALARQLGAAGRLQVGEYPLDPGTTPRALLLRMRDGKVISHKFTIVEGWNIHELRAALAKADPLVHDTTVLDDAALMKQLGHAGQHPEGRFLPETYVYTRGDKDSDVLARAYAALQKTLDAAWTSRAAGLPLKDKDEALTLASIVEKETAAGDERPQIAGVFVRRLQKGMLLQTDPTVIYGMGSRYAGNIHKTDLQADTPYNTYTRPGLPPTPIAMPGSAALQAATHPAAGDALYFVALGDGSGRHRFTASLAAHEAAVRDYVQRYRQQQAAQSRSPSDPESR